MKIHVQEVPTQWTMDGTEFFCDHITTDYDKVLVYDAEGNDSLEWIETCVDCGASRSIGEVW